MNQDHHVGSSNRRSNHRGGRSRTRRGSQEKSINHRFTTDQQHYQPHHHQEEQNEENQRPQQPLQGKKHHEDRQEQENISTMSRLNIVSKEFVPSLVSPPMPPPMANTSMMMPPPPRPPSTKPPPKKKESTPRNHAKPLSTPRTTTSSVTAVQEVNATATDTTANLDVTIENATIVSNTGTVALEVDFSLLNQPVEVNESNQEIEQDSSRRRLYERTPSNKHMTLASNVKVEHELKRTISDESSEQIEKQRLKEVIKYKS